MNVLLIQHLASLSRPSGYMRTAHLEPLGLEYLASVLESESHKVSVLSDNIDAARFYDILSKHKPDVIGFSVYSFALKDSLDLAQIARAAQYNGGRGPITIFGGYHPTACPEETAAEPCVDFVVVGEGEETTCELLRAIDENRELEEVSGIAFRRNGSVIKTSPRERIEQLDGLPYPKRDSQTLSQSVQHQICYPPPSRQQAVAQVLYSRGCPYSCSFCAAEVTWRRKIFWRDPAKVCDELEDVVSRFGTNLAYFPDLTFNANREKVLEFCREFHKRDISVHWWGLFRLDLLDEEMLDALVEANCVKLSIGVESPTWKCASRVKDQLHPDQRKYEQILKHANNVGLLLKAFVIIGFSYDTEESISSYPKLLNHLGFDEIRVTFATPFPGTRLFDEVTENKLLSNPIDWNSITTEEPVLKHPNLSRQALQSLQQKLIMDFYLSEEYADHACSKTKRFPWLRQSWIEFFGFLNSKGAFQECKTEFTVLMKTLTSNHV